MDEEWSFVEILRHLVLAVDVWVGRMIHDEPMPFHRLGLSARRVAAATAVKRVQWPASLAVRLAAA